MKKVKLSEAKRGQATVLIIVAVIVVVIIGAVFFIIGQNKRAESLEYFSGSAVAPELNALQGSIISCAEEVAKEGIEVIGLQGGYYKTPEGSYDLDSVVIPYYYNLGSYGSISRGGVEEQLSIYVDENIESCLSSVSSEFKISYGIVSTTVLIKEESVQFNVDLPMKIKRESYEIIFELKDHFFEVDSELYSILELANYITESHKEDPELYCISCVSEKALEDDLYVDIVNVGANEMLVIISENHTRSEPYSFEFLNRYSGDEESPLTQVGGEALEVKS